MKLDVLHALRDPGTAYAFAVEQTIAPQDVSGEEIAFDPRAALRASDCQ